MAAAQLNAIAQVVGGASANSTLPIASLALENNTFLLFLARNCLLSSEDCVRKMNVTHHVIAV
jgi:hypothetical protein